MFSSTIKAIPIALVTASITAAHTGASGVVKERMDAMVDMKDQSKIFVSMLKGETDIDRSFLQQAADQFTEHGKAMTKLFPDTHASRHGPKTEALNTIWDNWNDFSDAVSNFIESSKKLSQSVANNDSADVLRKRFKEVSASCKSCHKAYRQK